MIRSFIYDTLILRLTSRWYAARWMEILKPMLKRVTTIAFGRVTYEDDFKAQIRAAGLELEESTPLVHHGGRASYIAVGRPVSAVVKNLEQDGGGRSKQR